MNVLMIQRFAATGSLQLGTWEILGIAALVLVALLLIRSLLRGKSADGDTNDTASADAAAIVPPSSEAIRPAVSSVQDDGVLIAVITAAVSAAMEEEGTLPPGGFRVVSFRRASNARAWNRK